MTAAAENVQPQAEILQDPQLAQELGQLMLLGAEREQQSAIVKSLETERDITLATIKKLTAPGINGATKVEREITGEMFHKQVAFLQLVREAFDQGRISAAEYIYTRALPNKSDHSLRPEHATEQRQRFEQLSPGSKILKGSWYKSYGSTDYTSISIEFGGTLSEATLIVGDETDPLELKVCLDGGSQYELEWGESIAIGDAEIKKIADNWANNNEDPFKWRADYDVVKEILSSLNILQSLEVRSAKLISLRAKVSTQLEGFKSFRSNWRNEDSMKEHYSALIGMLPDIHIFNPKIYQRLLNHYLSLTYVTNEKMDANFETAIAKVTVGSGWESLSPLDQRQAQLDAARAIEVMRSQLPAKKKAKK